MIIFTNFEEYLSAYQSNRQLAAAPVSLVAEFLNKTPGAISARIKSERLGGIRIGRVTLVLLSSILEMQKTEERDVNKVEKYLKNLVRNKVSKVFYKPVMAQVNLKTTVPNDRLIIGRILAKVSRRSKKQRDVMLSVIVHKKSGGITLPGEGFFNLAASKEFGYKWEYDDEFVEMETKRVLNKYIGK